MNDDGRTLATLRLELVAARSGLRQQELALETERAVAEQAVADRAGGEAGMGANAEARKRHLLIHLGDDRDFCNRENRVEQARSDVEELTARIANAEDERRERERLTREKLADALVAFSPRELGEAGAAALEAGLTRDWKA